MKELKLIKSADFGGIQCDFYGDGKDFWTTRSQVGKALEYSNPGNTIKDIHSRHRARLDKYSRSATQATVLVPAAGRRRSGRG